MHIKSEVEDGLANTKVVDEVEEEFVITNRQIFFIVLNVIDHILILGTTIYLCWISRELSNVTNLHAFLCTIGYVLLMAEAIVSLAGENTLTFMLSRRGASHLHWIFQVIGGTCIFIGITVMYQRKSNHFKSNHALIGIVSVSCIAIVFLSGLPALFARALRKRIKPVISKFTHNSLGVFCFVTGMAAQVDAYVQKRWLRSKASDEVVYVVTVTTILIALLSLPGALRQLNQQFRGVVRVARK